MNRSQVAETWVRSVFSVAWSLGVSPLELSRRKWMDHKPVQISKRQVWLQLGHWSNIQAVLAGVVARAGYKWTPNTPLPLQWDLEVLIPLAVDALLALPVPDPEPPRGTKKQPPPTDPVETQRLRDKLNALTAERRTLLRRIDQAETTARAFEEVNSRPPVTEPLPVHLDGGKRNGTVGLVLSDWHAGDVVDREAVNGINKFDPEIARARAERLVTGFGWTVDLWRNGYSADHLVIGILGDMVSGWIHEEQLPGNSMSPPEEVVFCGDLLEQTLLAVLDMGWRFVEVVCLVGNHGRITRKIHHSNRAQTNYEWMLYHDLARRLSSERVHFMIPNSEFFYSDVGGLTVRWAHGDFFKYSRGVGGITIPMNKALMAQDRAKAADLTCFGHWHQYLSLPHVLSNGTMKGYDAFAQHFGFAPEPPSQTAFIVDHERGFPWSKRIWVGDMEDGPGRVLPF